MGKAKVLLPLVLLVLIYPVYGLFQAAGAIGLEALELARQELLNYQISLWVSWVVFVIVAVYYKWTQKRNYFFYFTYGFILIGSAIFGYLNQLILIRYNLPNPFPDSHTLGIFSAVRNLIPAAVLTAALHAAVWWFTRRWHRR